MQLRTVFTIPVLLLHRRTLHSNYCSKNDIVLPHDALWSAVMLWQVVRPSETLV